MKKVTCWKREKLDKNHKPTGIFSHNHIEEGWSDDDSPRPRGTVQKSSWSGANWKKEFAYLVDNRVIMKYENKDEYEGGSNVSKGS